MTFFYRAALIAIIAVAFVVVETHLTPQDSFFKKATRKLSNMGSSSSSLEAAKVINSKADLTGKNALCFGATAGIGAATAKKLASRGCSVTIVGRNDDAAKKLLGEFKQVSPATTAAFDFIKADLSSMVETKRVADEYIRKNTRLDYLVLSQGFFTLDGTRNPTKEGIDFKLALHYYSRAAALRTLLPLLSKTASADKNSDVRVLTVLSAGKHDSYAGYKTDPQLTSNFGLKNGADMTCFYQDLMLDYFSQQSQQITFIHQAPGIVQSDLARDSNIFTRALLGATFAVAGKTTEDCGEFMAQSLLDPKYKKSGPGAAMHLLDQYGDAVSKTALHTAEAVDFVMKDTFVLIDSVLAKKPEEGAKGAAAAAVSDAPSK